eukprot:CAMPEP_0177256340 /NCGR_PEP_ID=MMETSP0367-20130122/56883_1 /TAXON_ID=447022 ORGANISM="Scrippsiella hangoei-like, Strain SHHI-4" /NCGR_SAMPLE_ID=MMETSP0367 /ASSEMBLY_ACC=CAM_ASM_000362 /LENGTH=155 /DNA_ID=CAMNT_0018710205 /DNA_START=55 /DNA_END=518 /DNA_ORIENTATION=-
MCNSPGAIVGAAIVAAGARVGTAEPESPTDPLAAATYARPVAESHAAVPRATQTSNPVGAAGVAEAHDAAIAVSWAPGVAAATAARACAFANGYSRARAGGTGAVGLVEAAWLCPSSRGHSHRRPQPRQHHMPRGSVWVQDRVGAAVAKESLGVG